MNKLKLTCGQAAYHALLIALDKTRKGSATVRVDKAALQALVLDHGRVLSELGHERYEDAK